jgi:PQQ-dependent dehydrogenase (methanol/ethanol family)
VIDRLVGAALLVAVAACIGVAGAWSVYASSQASRASPPRRRGPAPPAMLVTPAMLERGRTVYLVSCASCHGADGKGAARPVSADVKPLDDSNATLDRLTDLDVATLVERGSGRMDPVPAVRGDDLVAVVAFVRSLSRSDLRIVELQSIAQQDVRDYVPVTAAMLANPPAGDWLMIGRTYDGWSFSPLDEINRRTIGQLQLAWSRAMEPGGQYTTPLVHNGVLYIANPNDAIQALDGRSGDLIWEYRYRSSTAGAPMSPEEAQGRDGRQGSAQRNPRNIAIYRDRIFHVTHDAHVIAIDARTGALKWDTPEAPGVRGIGHFGGPLVAAGQVVVGHSAAATAGPTGGFIAAYDVETGRETWRRYLIPRAGEPGDETWVGLPYEQRRHVAAWGVGSYDPEANLIYWGTSVPAPSLEVVRGTPKGDALYSNSTVALDAATGRLVWHYQHLPRDNWDLDHVFERYLIDVVVAPDPRAVRWISPRVKPGERRSVVTGIPGKTGIVYTLDRRTGEFLWARETIHQNVVADINPATGRVSIDETLVARPFQETFVCPSLGGGKNWPSGAYSPLTRVMYQPQQNMCMLLTGNTDKPTAEDGYATSWIIVEDPAVKERPYPVGRLDAVSIETGRTVWLHQQRAGMLGSLIATAGGLVFGGDVNRRFKAFDDTTGEVLWETILNGPVSGHPVSYAIDGRQYIAVPAGGNTASPERRTLSLHPEIKPPAGVNGLFVFALPAHARSSPTRSMR